MRTGLQGFWGSGVAIDFKNGDFIDITGVGSYDFTGGRAYGASLYTIGIKVRSQS